MAKVPTNRLTSLSRATKFIVGLGNNARAHGTEILKIRCPAFMLGFAGSGVHAAPPVDMSLVF